MPLRHVHPYARDWIVLARSTRAEAFAALYPGPFLLGCEVPDADYVFETGALALEREEQQALSFADGPSKSPTPAEETWSHEGVPQRTSTAGSRRWVIPIQKKPGAPAQHRIFVGRDAGNDIYIPHPTVSKLQGYFSRSRNGDEDWSFLDADSANGTRWNHQFMPSRQAIRVRDGDRLSFGKSEFFWLTAEKLHAELLGMDQLRERKQ